ncbi:MAG: asparagine synthase (glutamine-hydrolyzing) [Candidatus Omnitrophota bacterium]
MCGISGIVDANLKEDNFKNINRTLSHRGPDGEDSVFLDNSVFLGHRRLSVIDLSQLAKQPMCNEDGSVWITYNGEIYNFKELRTQLKAKGHNFRSNSDTEVLLHLYEEKGIEFVNEINGMFAFAIYDRKNGCIFLVRDRLGIKPLYYSQYGNSFVFGSEIKALLASGLIPKDMDSQAVYDYFSFLYVPCPRTIFSYIKQLPPANYIRYSLKDRKLELKQYWSPYDKNSDMYKHKDEALDDLRGLVEDSVKKRLISDVPLGVFLSGGIDSSILSAIAARESSNPLKTFTVFFKGKGVAPNDDREYALKMSRFLKTNHTEIEVDVTDPGEMLGLIKCFDQPYANPTFYLSYLISKVTKEHVTVALSGAGGDELFGGYPRYRVLKYARFLSMFPKALGKGISKLAQIIPEDPDNSLPRRMKLFLRGLGREFSDLYLNWTYYFNSDEKARLLRPMLSSNSKFFDSSDIIRKYFNQSQGDGLLNRMQYVDLKTFLLDNILEYTDKTSMAVGLESRVPFLDHRVVEASFRMPSSFKIQKNDTKVILKEAFRDLLPKDIFSAPKRGFCAPMAVWIDKYLDFYFDQTLSASYVKKQGIFDFNYIQNLRKEHKQRKKDNSMQLFSIIMFDIWYNNYSSI